MGGKKRGRKRKQTNTPPKKPSNYHGYMSRKRLENSMGEKSTEAYQLHRNHTWLRCVAVECLGRSICTQPTLTPSYSILMNAERGDSASNHHGFDGPLV